MRSAERLVAGIVLATGLAGCASAPDSPSTGPRDGAPVSSIPAVTAPARNEAPVPPAVRNAFDEALRALRAGRTAEAERGLRALAQAHPELGGVHANLGLIYRQAGKPAEAVAELELAVNASPQQPLYFNQLGIAYRHQGQFPKARDAYEKALSLDPGYAAATLNLGVLNDLYLGDKSRALALYERYLALVPAGDPAVLKWVADLKNRKAPAANADRKEKE